MTSVHAQLKQTVQTISDWMRAVWPQVPLVESSISMCSGLDRKGSDESEPQHRRTAAAKERLPQHSGSADAARSELLSGGTRTSAGPSGDRGEARLHHASNTPDRQRGSSSRQRSAQSLCSGTQHLVWCKSIPVSWCRRRSRCKRVQPLQAWQCGRPSQRGVLYLYDVIGCLR